MSVPPSASRASSALANFSKSRLTYELAGRSQPARGGVMATSAVRKLPIGGAGSASSAGFDSCVGVYPLW
jgi:hypothetical protein